MRRLERRVKELEKELQDVKTDRDTLRGFIGKQMREQITLLAESKYYSPSVMIEKTARILQKVEYFYW